MVTASPSSLGRGTIHSITSSPFAEAGSGNHVACKSGPSLAGGACCRQRSATGGRGFENENLVMIVDELHASVPSLS
jgi:hypothetical protein